MFDYSFVSINFCCRPILLVKRATRIRELSYWYLISSCLQELPPPSLSLLIFSFFSFHFFIFSFFTFLPVLFSIVGNMKTKASHWINASLSRSFAGVHSYFQRKLSSSNRNIQLAEKVGSAVVFEERYVLSNLDLELSSHWINASLSKSFAGVHSYIFNGSYSRATEISN